MLIASMLVGCSKASDQPAGDLRQQLIDTYVGGLSSAQQLEMLTTPTEAEAQVQGSSLERSG